MVKPKAKKYKAKIKGKTIKTIDADISWKSLKVQYNNKQIAKKLGVSERTVRRHRKGLSKRFHKKTRQRLIKQEVKFKYRVAEMKATVKFRKDEYSDWQITEVGSNGLQKTKKTMIKNFKENLQKLIDTYGKENVRVVDVDFIEISKL